MKRLFVGLLAVISFSVFAQSAIIRGEASAGVYENLKSTSGVLQSIINSGTITTNASAVDPCQSSAVAKSSALFNITTATTTALVAPSGSLVVYACSFTTTISNVITTANTLKFIQGTGAACASAPSDLTGTFNAGSILAAQPTVIAAGQGGTLFKTAAAGGLCATTAIGASASFNGVVTYVQQ